MLSARESRLSACNHAQAGVIGAYRMYASFLRIRRAESVACISSFFTGLPAIRFTDGPLDGGIFKPRLQGNTHRMLISR